MLYGLHVPCPGLKTAAAPFNILSSFKITSLGTLPQNVQTFNFPQGITHSENEILIRALSSTITMWPLQSLGKPDTLQPQSAPFV